MSFSALWLTGTVVSGLDFQTVQLSACVSFYKWLSFGCLVSQTLRCCTWSPINLLKEIISCSVKDDLQMKKLKYVQTQDLRFGVLVCIYAFVCVFM